MNQAVVADGLTKRYGQTVALDRCSFAIPGHTIVALVGPNGAGKSTLLHCAIVRTRRRLRTTRWRPLPNPKGQTPGATPGNGNNELRALAVVNPAAAGEHKFNGECGGGRP